MTWRRITIGISFVLFVVLARQAALIKYASLKDKSLFQIWTRLVFDGLYSSSVNKADHLTDEKIEQIYKIWGPRLAQNGSVGEANQALNAYNCAYTYVQSTYQPNWFCIGPTGKPAGGRATGNGQIHRIVFDPNYDAKTNHTVYAISHFGGLWKSETEKVFWKNLNTDVQLPFTTIADLAVHPIKTDHLFIATGDGDYGRIFDHDFSEISGLRITPTQTAGVYRSTDGGTTWHSINGSNNELCMAFDQGGNIRRILINPEQPKIAYIATTAGVFRCPNILDAPDDIKWTKVLDSQVVRDTEFRGIAIKPKSAGKVVYAGGSGIYRSEDSGLTWTGMTTDSTNDIKGLDLNKLPTGDNPLRINVATTPGDPDRLYAYIFGKNYNVPKGECNNKKKWAWLYVFKNNQWHKVWEKNTCSSFYLPQRRWMALAVSPNNPNHVFLGTTIVLANDPDVTYKELISGHSMSSASMYNGSGIHADIHALAFEPKNLNQYHPRLFAGTHGGVSVNSYISTTNKERSKKVRAFKRRWKRIDDGLQVATIWDFDQSAIYPNQILIGTQDNGVIKHSDDSLTAASTWASILGGDGYGAMFDNWTNLAWIKNQSHIYSYNYITGTKKLESNILPKDLQDQKTTFHRALESRNHPVSHALYTVFGELYRRDIQQPKKGMGADSIWTLKSDIGKVVRGGWQREIYAFEISDKDPDYIYLVCSGNDGTPPDDFVTEPRLFRTTKGGCDGKKDYGHRDDPISCFEQIDLDALQADNPADTKCPFITSVAIDDDNPNHIWVSFSGYDARLKVWSWTFNPLTGIGTWSNADPHNTLNNLPVNFVRHQSGTKNRLYIGTDAGVWIKDEGEDRWEKYGDFPNVRVTGLKINYCANQLVVATWGRGVWVGDLLAPVSEPSNHLMIDGLVAWSGDHALNRNLELTDGAQLHIKNGSISLPAGGKIIIHPGATLIVDQATLTNHCQKSWKGLYILTKGTGTTIKMPRMILHGLDIDHADQPYNFIKL